MGSTLRFSHLASLGLKPLSHEPGKGWSGSQYFQHSAPEIRPPFLGRKDLPPLNNICCGSEQQVAGGQDERCWCPAPPGRKSLWLRARERGSPVHLAARVWCKVFASLSRDWREREQDWFKHNRPLPFLTTFLWICLNKYFFTCCFTLRPFSEALIGCLFIIFYITREQVSRASHAIMLVVDLSI